MSKNLEITTKYFLIRVMGTIVLFFLMDLALGTFLSEGLEKYYGLNSNAEMALIGHSHLMLGINKTKLEDGLDIKVAKYTREGVNIADRSIMVNQLINSNKKVKTIIYGVDAWSFTSEGLSKNSYAQFYPFLNSTKIDSFIESKATFADYWTKKIIKTTRYDETLLSSAIRGYLGNWTNLKYGNVNIENLKLDIEKNQFRKIINQEENINIFKETISTLLKKDIKVILLYVPTIDLLEHVQQKEFDHAIAVFDQVSSENSAVEFLNLQEPWSSRYELFYDPIHLNPQGQKLVTEAVIKYLKMN